jgi:hypothetical protein
VISYFALTAITVRALFGQLRVRKQPYRAVYLQRVNAESGILCCGGVSHGMLDIQTGAGRKSPAPLRGLKRAQGGGGGRGGGSCFGGDFGDDAATLARAAQWRRDNPDLAVRQAEFFHSLWDDPGGAVAEEELLALGLSPDYRHECGICDRDYMLRRGCPCCRD